MQDTYHIGDEEFCSFQCFMIFLGNKPVDITAIVQIVHDIGPP
jgi:hypothetical protein